MVVRRIAGLGFAALIASMLAAAAAAQSVKRGLVPTEDEAADEVVIGAIFGPLDFHSTSRNFRGGQVECRFGGGVLDLRDSVLAPEGATLRIRAVFGGGQVLVPEDWKVVSSVTGLGGLSDIRSAKGHVADAPELVIEAALVAAGFAVMSKLDADGRAWPSDEGLAS
jgi:predicted membrane protein